MKYLKILRLLASIILIFLFTATVILTIISHALVDNLTDISTYEAAIQQTQLAERGRGLLANGLVTYSLFTQQSTSNYISGHTLETWDSVADALIPSVWLEENLILIVSSIVEWLNDPEVKYPQLEIDMSPVIGILQSPQGSLAVIPLLQGTKPCAPDISEIVFLGDNLISCLPSNGNIASYGDKIALILADNIVPIISFQTLEQTGLITPPFIQTIGTIRNSYNTLTLALSLGIKISVLLFFLYALLWSNSPRKLITKLPWPLYAAGGFSLVLLGLLFIFFQFWIDNAIRIAIPLLAIEYHSLLIDILEVLSGGIKKQWLVWSIYLIVAGLLIHILIFSYDWVKNRRTPEIEPEGRRRHRIRKQYR